MLAETVEHALGLLEGCRGGLWRLCGLLLEALHELLRCGHVAAAPALVLGPEGEPVEAFYAEARKAGDPGWIVVSPHVLQEPRYAARILLHEPVHALGLPDDDVAEAVALHLEDRTEAPSPRQP